MTNPIEVDVIVLKRARELLQEKIDPEFYNEYNSSIIWSIWFIVVEAGRNTQ